MEDSEPNRLNELKSIVRNKPIDKAKLREFGRKYGFFEQSYREKVWPLVIDLNLFEFYKLRNLSNWKDKIVPNKYTDQIDKDVDRSLTAFDVFSNMDESTLSSYRSSLEHILKAYFSLNPHHHYYQGFHDVCSIFIYVFGQHAAFIFADATAQLFFRDFLMYPFDRSVVLQMKLMKYILQEVDTEIYELLRDFDIPVFAIPWLLTWFAHSFSDINTVMRIYDYLLSSPPTSIIYMCVAMMLITKDKLFASHPTLELGEIHTFYQNLHKEDIDLEQLIQTTMKLEETVDLHQYLPALNANFPQTSLVTEYLEKTKGLVKQKLEPAKTGFFAKKNIIRGVGAVVVALVITVLSRKLVFKL